MIRVKICGLTRIEDAIWANKLLPDYVGFVFAPSRRRITPHKARKIIERLDKGILKVGVFVNPTLSEIEETLRHCPLDIIQLHGEEAPSFCAALPLPVWKAIRVQYKNQLGDINRYEVEAVLLDGYHPAGYGGMNQTFPWEWVKDVDAGKHRIILAGGINVENVTEAVSLVRPYAVDVSSGVETNGVKDPDKIEKFIRKVRSL